MTGFNNSLRILTLICQTEYFYISGVWMGGGQDSERRRGQEIAVGNITLLV